MDYHKQSLQKLEDSRLGEEFVLDKETKEASEIFNIDVVSVVVEIFDECFWFIDEDDVHDVMLGIFGKILLVSQQIIKGISQKIVQLLFEILIFSYLLEDKRLQYLAC